MSQDGTPYTTIAALLRLSKIRSDYIIGKALAEKYPKQDAWLAMMDDPELLEQLDAVGFVASDIRDGIAASDADSPEAVAEIAAQHYGRALESVELFAEHLEVDVHDLLNVLTND